MALGSRSEGDRGQLSSSESFPRNPTSKAWILQSGINLALL